MSQLITKTKVLPPRHQGNLLHRQQLLDEFARMRPSSLVILTAPAGYGKTSLLTQWAAADPRPFCWYTVDDLDVDPHRFMAHWFAAISQHFPHFGLQSDAILRSYAENTATLDQVIVNTINELYDTVEEDFVLIIDDYHFVDGQAEIDYFVSRFIQNSVPNCQLVLSSRKPLVLQNMALLVARGQADGIDDALLAFSQTEVQALIQHRFQREISLEAASELAESTEGWITGLLLSAHTPLAFNDKRLRLARATRIGLDSYLAQQVLDQQPEAMRFFLMRAAVLEEFDAALCREIFEPDWYPPGVDWQPLLDQIIGEGLFAQPVGEDGLWLRFHRLFQDFLLQRLREELPFDEPKILRRLVSWLRSQHEWERAFHLLNRLDDVPALAELVIEAGPHLIRAGRIQLVDRWTDAIPHLMRDRWPELHAVRGVAQVLLGNMADGLALFDRAQAGLTESHGSAASCPAMVRLTVWRAVTLRLLGDYELATQESYAALALIDSMSDDDKSLGEMRALTQKNVGLCFRRQGRLVEALTYLRSALDLYRRLDIEQDVATLHMDIAVIQMGMGNIDEALVDMEFAAKTWRRHGQIQRLSLVLNNRAVLYHKRGQLIEAAEDLAEAVSYAQRSAYRRGEVWAYASIGDLLFDLELWTGAEQLISETLSIADEFGYRFLVLYAHMQQALVAAMTNDGASALALLEKSGEQAVADQSAYERGLYELTAGRVHVLQDLPDKAIPLLEEAAKLLGEDVYVVEVLIAHFYICAALQATGAADQATDLLAKTLARLASFSHPFMVLCAVQPIIETIRTIPVPAALAAQHTALLRAVFATQLQISAARRAIRQNPPAQLAHHLTSAARIQIRALGRTEAHCNGKYVSNADWKALVARDLFYCLLTQPDGLTREEIGAIFWPEATPGQLRTRFKNTIYRLRSALGSDIVIYEDDLYRVNQLADYDYDVDAFLDQLTRVERATEQTARLAALQRAVELYTGEFSPEIEDEWAATERARLERLYRQALLQLCKLQLHQGAYQEGLHTCTKMTQLDPCWEEAHRLAMSIHAALGNRASIVRQFEQCQRTLRQELELKPSQQTYDLFETLTEGAL